jgi:activator of HSP90 ATPase
MPSPQRFGTLQQTVFFEAFPLEVYEALLDPRKHSAFTGQAATTSDKAGYVFTAADGYITGKNLELVKGKKIVQEWRTTEFPADYPMSRLEFTLTAKKGGTELRMLQTKIPADQVASYNDGWKSFYWEPLAKYLAENKPKKATARKKK